MLPNSTSPLARTLKLNGYSTAQFGKCHEVPVWEASQYYPTLYEGTTPVEPRKTPDEGYHLMEDMTDKAMARVSQQKALARQ